MSDFSDTHDIQLVLLSRSAKRAPERRSQCIHRARLSLSLAYFHNESHRRRRGAFSLARPQQYRDAPHPRGDRCYFFLSPDERLTMQYVLVSCAGRLYPLVDKKKKEKKTTVAWWTASCNSDSAGGFKVKLLQLLHRQRRRARSTSRWNGGRDRERERAKFRGVHKFLLR